MAKVKSRWWIQSGFTLEQRQASYAWRQQEEVRLRSRQTRLKLRGQRMALLGVQNAVSAKMIFQQFLKAEKAEMVYDVCGKLRIVIVRLGLTVAGFVILDSRVIIIFLICQKSST